MNIIQIAANENGSRPPIQQWSGVAAPEGYAAVACDPTPFYEAMGFVTLTIEGGTVTAMEANTASRDAYLAALPPEQEPQPTPQEDADALMVDHEYRLTLLELGVGEGVN